MKQEKVNERGSRGTRYTNKNRLNGLPLNILRVLSKSPHEDFIIAYIRKNTGRPEWGYLSDCLTLLEDYGCVKYTSKTKSKIGHDTYMITEWGLKVISKYDSRKDRVIKTIRALELGAVRTLDQGNMMAHTQFSGTLPVISDHRLLKVYFPDKDNDE